MAHSITVNVNGARYAHQVEDRLLLVHYIRDVLGLTGTHVGCDTSQCGACTVLVDGLAVKSCTLLAVQADGSNLLTIEGLASHDAKGQITLHPLQQAFWEEHGLQCGFCTPGMILTLYQVLERDPDPTDQQIRHSLAGNICRCTGYQNIVKAAHNAAGKLRRS